MLKCCVKLKVLHHISSDKTKDFRFRWIVETKENVIHESAMEWLLSNTCKVGEDGLSLGWTDGDEYHVSSDCLDTIRSIEQDLAREDVMTRNVRCSLGVSHFVQKDLVRVLGCSQDLSETFCAAIRLLVNLTLPVECLLHVETVIKSPSGKVKIQQLEQHLLDSKKAFLDVKSTASVLKAIRDVLQKELRDVPLKTDECILLRNCLLLLRNILHVPEKTDSVLCDGNEDKFAEWQMTQNKLIWNMFLQGLDSVLLLLMNSNYRDNWTTGLVELIALLYKDQHVTKLQQLLTRASSSSDSSEDDIESDFSKYSSTGNSDSSKISLPASDSGCPNSPDKWSSEASNRPSSGSDGPAVSTRDAPQQSGQQDSSIQDQSDQSSPLSDGERSPTKTKAFFSLHQSEEPVPEVSYETSSGCSNERTSSSDEDNRKAIKIMTLQSSDHWRDVHSKMNVKHRHPHLHMAAPSGSDFSNDDESDYLTSKQRNHPPKNRKVKNATCCSMKGTKSEILRMDATDFPIGSKGRLCGKPHFWEKRKGIRAFVDTLARTPTDDDISNLLKDFTLNFLHHGFEGLVVDLKRLLLLQGPTIIDKCHFLWLLSYFLRLANTIQISIHQISCILSVEMISYLTFEGVLTCEELELSFKSQRRDFKPLLRRMHLLVTALRELISTVESFTKKPVQKRDKALIQKLHLQLASLSDLRQLPLLLIRSYNPLIHTKQFLVDLITVNHLLLLLLERASTEETFKGHFSVFSHLKQFATPKVMEQYSYVLNDFKINGEFINECVFTMMHHVAGDLGSPEALFHPHILKTFSMIMEDDWDVKEYWEDLMGYVMNKFLRAAEIRTTEPYLNHVFGCVSGESEQSEDEVEELAIEAGSITTTSSSDTSSSIDNQDMSVIINGNDDSLYWWYLHFEQDEDTIGRLVEHFAENGLNYSREDVLNQLHTRGIINPNEYAALKAKEMEQLGTSETLAEKTENAPEIQENNAEGEEKSSEKNEIKQLLTSIAEAGFQEQVKWIQQLLLEACYIRLRSSCYEHEATKCYLMEPIPLYSISLNQSIPIVPFSEIQEQSLKNEHFIQLLHKLGFHLPADVGRLYPRIPCFWMADVLYTVAECLGPIEQEWLKFETKEVKSLLSDHSVIVSPTSTHPPCTVEASVLSPKEMDSLCLEDHLTSNNTSGACQRTSQPISRKSSLNSTNEDADASANSVNDDTTVSQKKSDTANMCLSS